MATLVPSLLLTSAICTLIECKGGYQRSKRELLSGTLPGPINDPSKAIPWYLPKKVETVEKGIPNTANYRVFFRSEHGLISPIHDIPLYANHDHKIFNMIVEIPRLSNAKLEISLKETLNPLRHATKNGTLRYVNKVVPHDGGFLVNYGALPNTWDNPHKLNHYTGHFGGGDPLDVVEIGERVAKQGEVIQVKVLGVIGMIDAGKTDWKIIAIDVHDSKAAKFNDIDDVEKLKPGFLKGITNWIKQVDVEDGKNTSTLLFDGKFKDKEFAERVIEDAQEEWIELMSELGEERDKEDSEEEEKWKNRKDPGLSVVNTCIRSSNGKITFQEAEAMLNNRTFPTRNPLDKSHFYEINITARGSKTHKISV
uniref:inorganic diphosphatase n=1 Tax=Cacopsylla melanoneura TaxID=428564 RepID=A0A8D9F6Q0_9HEMI